MLGNPSLMMRIAVGKTVGLLIGVSGFFFLQYQYPEGDSLFRWGFLFWYTTMGAFVGLFGVLTYHPVLKMPIPWWFGGVWIGAWMNFQLVLFTYDQIQAIMLAIMGNGSSFTNPFWIVLEGAIVGVVIGAFATWSGGSGPETVREQEG